MTDAEVLTLTCRVCGADYLTDARDRDAVLWHYRDGAHRVLPSPTGRAGVIGPADELAMARVEVLAIAVRLADVNDDLERVMAHLDAVTVPE